MSDPDKILQDYLITEYKALAEYFGKIITFRFTIATIFMVAVGVFFTNFQPDYPQYLLLIALSLGIWIVELRNRGVYHNILRRAWWIETYWADYKQSDLPFFTHLTPITAAEDDSGLYKDILNKDRVYDTTHIMRFPEFRSRFISHSTGLDIIYLSVIFYLVWSLLQKYDVTSGGMPMNLQINTFYYTLGVIPKVIGTIVAIVATFTFFRITNLKEYLIGDGKSVLNRWNEPGYDLFPTKDENTLQYGRLRDGCDRRSIQEIKNVIKRLAQLAKDQGCTKEKWPTGLQYLYEDRFCGTETHIKQLKVWTLVVVALSFISIVSSIICLALADYVMSQTYISLGYWVLWVNVVLFVISLILAIYLMYLALSERTLHEIDRQVK